MTQFAANYGQLFRQPFDQPLSVDGRAMPLCFRVFYLTNSTTPATVYQDAALTTPYAQPIAANSSGVFSPIYLNPAIEYRSQLFNSIGQMQEDADPVNNNTAGTPFIAGYQRAAYKPASTSRTSTTTQTADPDLQVAIPGPGFYRVDLDIALTAGAAGATPGLAIAILFTGSLATGPIFNNIQFYIMEGVANSINPASSGLALGSFIQPINVGAVFTTLPLGLTAVTNTMRFSGIVQTLSAGTLELIWAQGLSSASATTLLAGSSLNVLQVA